MNAPIRARDLCIRTSPLETRVVALVSSYFDDSETTGHIWVVGGYAGYTNQWDLFERFWDAALKTHGVPYFHMREMADPNGVFKKWHPPQDHQDEVEAFIKDLVKAIRASGLRMFGSAVWLKDLEQFNREKNVQIKSYPLAAYACLTQLAHHYERAPVTANFDRADKIDSKLVTARAYAESDKFLFPGACDLVSSVPIPRGLTAKDIPPLQAADFGVWEARKGYLTIQPWQMISDRPLGDREAQWQHFKEWSRLTYDQEYPIQRKSLEALIEGNMPIKWVLWDYHQLCLTHAERRGVWSFDQAAE
jgi:hypothetical protein